MRRRANRVPERRRLRASDVALALLAALFVVMRLFTAWLLRCEVNGDLAVVQMMVRDMASGGSIPAFFYGQAYMGSLEPVANAACHLLFGRTDFGTELGTALFAVLMVVAVVRMARRAGGEWAAVAALAFLVVGPTPFAHYAVSPRGGYGVLLFATAGLLDVGAQLVVEARRGGDCRFSSCVAAGLLAGIGFWCDQLVFPAAAAAAVGVLLFAPRLLARSRLWLGGVLGFAIGSAPFWVWNARNGWESFQMAGSLLFDPVVVGRNLLRLVLERWPVLFDAAPHAPRAIGYAVAAASLALPALALRVFAPLPRRIHPDERLPPPGAKVQLSLCLLFLVLFLGCFVCSGFAACDTPRYLLPVLPAFAVLAGAACTSVRFRSANLLGVALLALLVGWQVRQLPNLAAKGRRDAARAARYRAAADYLAGKGTEVAYCSFRHNSMNLCGDGIAFTDSGQERVPAFRRRAELADSPAVVDDFLGIASWAAASGGSVCATNVGRLRIATDIVPPPCAVEDIPIGDGCISFNGQPVGDVLTDRTFVTAWELTDNRCEVEIDFGEPRPVCGVRCLVSGFGGNGRFRVFGRDNQDAPFRPLAPAVPNVACRWSGPRFYPDPWREVVESRFRPAAVDGVKIVFDGDVADGAIRRIREVQVLAPAPGKSPATPAEWHAAVDGLVDLLHRQGVNRLYASRWIANAVGEKTKGAIWTNHGPDLHPKPAGAPRPRARPVPVALDSFTALLVSPSGVPAMRTALEKCRIGMREVHADALGVLFIPESIQAFPWRGGDALGLLFDPDCPTFLPSAAWEERALENPAPKGGWTHGWPPTVPALRHWLRGSLTDNEAVTLRQALDLLTQPTLGGDARFAGLHTWRGARLLDDGASACAGGAMRLRHYWSSPRGALPDGCRHCVFVHFIGPDGYRFQDVFPLEAPPEGPDTTGRDGAEVLWHVDRRVTLPADAPAGLYEMRVGLCDAVFSSKRLHVDTRLPHRRNAVVVAPVFAIASKDNPDSTP